uniref:Uncharacterized protein n=1 Tax=Klebsiella quasipneumoniae TaxID=1463165 RepID=A0A483K5S8_9ENTR
MTEKRPGVNRKICVKSEEKAAYMKKLHLPALCQPKEPALRSTWGRTIFSMRRASRQVIIQQ